MKKSLAIRLTLALGILLAASAPVSAAMNAQQAKYFNLLKGKMLSNVNGVNSNGAQSGETKVAGVGISMNLPGLGNVTDMSSAINVHLCSDGSYIISTLDKIGNMNSAGRETGKWSVGPATSSNVTLLMTAKSGGSVILNTISKKGKLTVSFDSERTMINSQRWYRMKSSACK